MTSSILVVADVGLGTFTAGFKTRLVWKWTLCSEMLDQGQHLQLVKTQQQQCHLIFFLKKVYS